MAYLMQHPNFEVPYGMAWLHRMMSELHELSGEPFVQWRSTLAPLEAHAADVSFAAIWRTARFRAWWTA